MRADRLPTIVYQPGAPIRAGVHGFTLVELMALATMLLFLVIAGLPPLVRASQKTKAANCQSNLKQIGLALQNYADENSGWLPGPAAPLAHRRYGFNSSNELVWYITEQLGCPPPSNKPNYAPQLLCPSHPSTDARGLDFSTRADYILNDGRTLNGPPFGRPGAQPLASLSVSSVVASTSPAACFAIADADKANVNPTLPGWNELPYEPIHGKFRNQLYFDWHVESKRW